MLRVLFKNSNTKFPHSLSTTERAKGQGLFRKFFKLNGLSVAFLMENVLIVYAIRNGVSDPLVAVMASFIYLTMPFMIIGKISIANIGAARTWALGWFFRYVTAFIMVFAPIFALWGQPALVTATVLTGAFGFALFRSMGNIAVTPLEGEVTTPENRGNFLSGNFLRVNITHFLAMTLLIIVLRFIDDIWVYQLVIAAGCMIGIYASTVLARIPESQAPCSSARKPLAQAFRTMWKQNRVRKLLFAWSAGLVSFTIVIPFMMIAVKSGYGISDYAALSFSLILLIGGISSSLSNGIIADQVGPRPLLLLYTGGLLLPAGFWALAPEQFYALPVGLTFFLAGFCKFGIALGLGHYFLSCVDDSDRVGSALFMRVFAGAAAGLTGSVLGGGLLSFFDAVSATGLDVYRYYFRLIIVILLAMIVLVYRLERLEEWSIKSILGLMVSPRDIRALYVLKKLRNHSGSMADSKGVQRLGAIGSMLSEKELRQQLSSPRLAVRVHALQALGRLHFGKETEDVILREVERGVYTTAWIAAEILGEHKIKRAIPLLRKGLSSADHFLQGKCMVALVLLEDEISYPKIISLFQSSDNPRIIIHGANALSRLEGAPQLSSMLEKSLEPGLPSPVIDEVLIAAAASVGAGTRFYLFLQQYSHDKKSGASDLLSDLSDGFFGKNETHIRRESLQGEIDDIPVKKSQAETVQAKEAQAGAVQSEDTHLADTQSNDDKYKAVKTEKEKPFKYFRMALETVAKGDDNPAALSVYGVLHRHGDKLLPAKVAFCMALILSVSLKERRPLTDGVD